MERVLLMAAAMQPSPLALHRRLDDLAIEALAAGASLPAARPFESDVSIEVIYDDADELAVTTRFVRFSAPYERVEIEPLRAPLPRRSRPTTFVKTVRARSPHAAATLAFDKVWFDQADDAVEAVEELPAAGTGSWWWLVVSLAIGAAAVAFMAMQAS
jgi:hypothetical protein